MESFDRLCAIAFEKEPMLDKIIQCKIDGMQNQQIQDVLKEEIDHKNLLDFSDPKSLPSEEQKNE